MRSMVFGMAIAAVVGASGCGKGSSSTPPKAATTETPISTANGPFTDTVIGAMKDGRPTFLVDMAPEATKLKGHGEGSQREYLMKRAIMILRAKGLNDPKLAQGDPLVVRMILLTELDEYNRPKWGTAPQIALLEAPRSSVAALSDEKTGTLTGAALEAVFSSRQFDLKPIAEFKGPS